MAVATIDATVGGASSNSYVTPAEAEIYFEIRPGSEKWDELDSDRKRAALIFATMLIDRETFWSRKNDSTQALKFPRGTAVSPIIPGKVKTAQMEETIDICNGNYVKRLDFIDLKEMGVRQSSVDETLIRMFPSFATAFPVMKLSPSARELLLPFIEISVLAARA